MNKRRVLIVAGPTEEPLDGVRYLSNRSTGQMGVELAREALRKGWQTTLVLGPSAAQVPAGVQLKRVRTARQMLAAARRALSGCRVLVMAAAVSDWRPQSIKRGKIKRGGGNRVIKLIENPDILKSLPAGKAWGQAGLPVNRRNRTYRIGFCLESGDPRPEARRKLRSKKLDLIVANRLGSNGGPFGSRPVTVWLVGRGGRERMIRKASKRKVAQTLFKTIDGAMAE